MVFTSRLDDEWALARCENAWLSPPEYEDPRCQCGNRPKYQIGDEYVCEDCVDQFRELVLPFDNEYCEYCGEDADEGYRVNGDFYCLECFDKSFGI